MVGVRGHDVGMMSAKDLALKMKELGYESLQLVAYKAIKGVNDQPGYLSPGLAFSIGYEFDKQGIHIGLIGSYFNLMDSNKERFFNSKERFKEYIKFAKDFRGYVVGTETGSYNEDWSYNPLNHTEEALEKVIEVIQELVDEAEKHGVIVGMEGVYDHIVSTPKRIRYVLDKVNSSNLQIIFDPVNLLHMGNYERSKELIEECFKLFGDRIVIIHAKDFTIENGKKVNVPLGKGLMDYDHFMYLVNKYKPSIDIIVEELEGQDLKESVDFIKKYQK